MRDAYYTLPSCRANVSLWGFSRYDSRPPPIMAKKGTSKPPADGSSPSLADLRRQVEALDRDMVARLNERAALAVQMGQLKAQSGQAAADNQIEPSALERAAKLNAGPLPDTAVRHVFRELISACRALETP